jgi:nucleotide sugar dehydrogenase
MNLSIIGIGKLGLCAALIYESKGYNVIGVDINKNYIEQLNNKSFQSPEPFVNQLLPISKNLLATDNLDLALKNDIIFLYIDTPTSEEGYDHSKVEKVLGLINQRKVSNKTLIIGSTCLPGFTNEAKKLLLDCTNTTLNYSPSFIAQGSIVTNYQNPDIVLIGSETENSGNIIKKIYESIVNNQPKYHIMGSLDAEITKISLNCFVTLKISYANMIGDIANKVGANHEKILNAVSDDSRIGTKCMKWGWGYGGPCFPRDNRALYKYSDNIGIDAKLSKCSDQYNDYHSCLMVELYPLDEYDFGDVYYKEGIPIIENSQKLAVAYQLVKLGKKIKIKDQYNLVKEKYGDIFEYY